MKVLKFFFFFIISSIGCFISFIYIAENKIILEKSFTIKFDETKTIKIINDQNSIRKLFIEKEYINRFYNHHQGFDGNKIMFNFNKETNTSQLIQNDNNSLQDYKMNISLKQKSESETLINISVTSKYLSFMQKAFSIIFDERQLLIDQINNIMLYIKSYDE